MSDNNNNKNEDEKDKFNRMLNELKENGNLDELDIEELKNTLEAIISKKEKRGFAFLKFLRCFLFNFVSLYVISTAVLGLLINSISLENIYYLPLVSLGISILFTMFKVIPFLNRKIYLYILPYVSLIAVAWALNNHIKVFDFDVVWLIYIFAIEFLFSLYKICRMRKKYSFLRR